MDAYTIVFYLIVASVLTTYFWYSGLMTSKATTYWTRVGHGIKLHAIALPILAFIIWLLAG